MTDTYTTLYAELHRPPCPVERTPVAVTSDSGAVQLTTLGQFTQGEAMSPHEELRMRLELSARGSCRGPGWTVRLSNRERET